MNYNNPLSLFLILFCVLSLKAEGQDKYQSVEESIEYLNNLYERNKHLDKYKIVSVGDDLVEITTVRLRSKEHVVSMEKDGKTMEDFPATRVLKRNDDGS